MPLLFSLSWLVVGSMLSLRQSSLEHSPSLAPRNLTGALYSPLVVTSHHESIASPARDQIHPSSLTPPTSPPPPASTTARRPCLRSPTSYGSRHSAALGRRPARRRLAG